MGTIGKHSETSGGIGGVSRTMYRWPCGRVWLGRTAFVSERHISIPCSGHAAHQGRGRAWHLLACCVLATINKGGGKYWLSLEFG